MNMIRPSYAGWGRGLVKATALSAVLLINSNLNVHAQGLPPVPGDGGTQPPREPTPEELDAQRKAQEAHWQKNLERFQPYLVKTVQQLAEEQALAGRYLSFDQLLDTRRTIVTRTVDEKIADDRKAQELLRKRARDYGIEAKDDEPPPILKFNEFGPVITIPNDVAAAQTIQTDKLWPGYGPGYGLGLDIADQNSVIGFWDVQHPQTAHIAFTNTAETVRRIDNKPTAVSQRRRVSSDFKLTMLSITSRHVRETSFGSAPFRYTLARLRFRAG